MFNMQSYEKYKEHTQNASSVFTANKTHQLTTSNIPMIIY